MTEACQFCGEWFEKIHHGQKYCCKECSQTAERKMKKERDAKRRRKQKNNVKATSPYPNIYGMVDIMMKLSKERGRVVQYGEVQRLLLTGRLKVKDGVMV